MFIILLFIILLPLGVWLIKIIQNMVAENMWRTQKRLENFDSLHKIMGELPDELIEQVLLRLPEESLMRFKSVSRAWNTRINSPSFVRSYGDSKYSSKKVMIYTGGQEPPIYSFSVNCREDEEALESIPHNFGYSEWPHDYEVVGSCDGLLFVSVKYPTFGLWIWNPSTRQYRILPRYVDDSKRDRLHTHYGFGCAISSKGGNCKDYKVVCIYEDVKFQIFTTCTNSWEIREDIPYQVDMDSFALVNAKLHFFGTKLDIVGEDITDGESVLLAFDIENEEFREVPEPNYEDGSLFFWGSELNTKLCVSLTNESQTRRSIWVMKEYGVRDSWTNMFCIDITNMTYLGGSCCLALPLHFFVDGKILLHAKYNNAGTNIEELESEETYPNNLLVYYDSRNHKVRIPKLDGIPIRYSTANYVETFISPDSI